MCGCLSCAPHWGPGLQPMHMPWSGNRTRDPLVRRPVLNPLSQTRQGNLTIFLKYLFILIIFKDFIYLFLERGREGEREGEKHHCMVASCTPPAGDLARNPGMYLDWELNQRPFGSQASAQSTEPHQPGHATLNF